MNYTNPAISIEGTLLMLDDVTPHVAAVVQAVVLPSDNGGEPEVVATTLSDESGKYRFINLKPGQYQVRCYTLKGYVYYGEEGRRTERQKGNTQYGETLQVECGKTLENIDFRIAPFKKGMWKTYTHLDGLASNYVHAIYSVPDGTLWFGTSGGVSRYDGKEFVNFTTQDGLVHNDVWAICRSPDGILWFGTKGGVSRYDGNEFKNFTTKDGLANNYVTAIHRAPDGVLWFGTGWTVAAGGGISRYDGKEFENFTTKDGLASNTVLSIYCDPNGVMWFGTFWGGVSRYDGKEFENFTAKDGLANSVSSIHGAFDGTLWFGTGDGISRYDGKEFKNFTEKDGLLNNWVWAIHRNPDAAIWLGTAYYDPVSGGVSRFSGGVSRYDGQSFVNFTTEDGLAHDNVLSICRASDDTLWFGTDGGGVSRYDCEEGVKNLTTKDGLAHNDVMAIYRAKDGLLWFGTQGGGVSLYDGKEFKNFTTKDGLAHNNVRVIRPLPDGALWFGTGWMGVSGGVSRYDGKNFEDFTEKIGLPRVQILDVHGASDGTTWFGTWGSGAFQYDGKKLVNFLADKIDIWPRKIVYAIHQAPDGAIWFVTLGSGVFRYDGKEFKNFTEEDGLADNWAFSIHVDPDGTLWFGTASGISRYDGKKFVNFTKKDGLAGNRVWTIYRDFDGRLWFGTMDGGVSCYDGITWTSLDTRDGLAGNSVFSIYQDSDGSLWFGAEGGITRYRRASVPPKVHIVSVTTDQTYTDLSAIPTFTHGTRATIAYGAIDFKTVPEKRQYRCRIYETSDMRHETSDSSLKSQVSSLPYNPPTKETSFDWIPEEPGTYIFQVQAIDRDLNYSEPAAVSLTIQPDPILVSMQAELNHLRREVREKYHFENIIGRSAAIRQVRALMEKAIDSGLTVLITGETGAGKELVAKAIHHNSPRKNRPLLELNCGAAPKELISSILFGHRKGAFTGAHEDRIGLFEAASGGTLLLDEIGDMPQDAQIHLLRVLQERKIQRLGEHISLDVDVRIIAMANRDLMKEAAAGRFREDLYYRLSVFPIHIPPLRERHEDIPPLAKHLL